MAGPSLPPLNLQTAATATASSQFSPGAVTFGAPGAVTSGGSSSIVRDVFVGVLTAVAVYFAFRLLKR